MAFVSSSLHYKRWKCDKKHKKFEHIAFEISLRTRDGIVIGVYTLPYKVTQLLKDDELNDICNWVALQKVNLDFVKRPKYG